MSELIQSLSNPALLSVHYVGFKWPVHSLKMCLETDLHSFTGLLFLFSISASAFPKHLISERLCDKH